MEEHSTTTTDGTTGLFAGEAWFDPIEAGIRELARGFIEELLEQELTAAGEAVPSTSGRRRSPRDTGMGRASAS